MVKIGSAPMIPEGMSWSPDPLVDAVILTEEKIVFRSLQDERCDAWNRMDDYYAAELRNHKNTLAARARRERRLTKRALKIKNREMAKKNRWKMTKRRWKVAKKSRW